MLHLVGDRSNDDIIDAHKGDSKGAKYKYSCVAITLFLMD